MGQRISSKDSDLFYKPGVRLLTAVLVVTLLSTAHAYDHAIAAPRKGEWPVDSSQPVQRNGAPETDEPDSRVLPLEIGIPIQRELRAGERHSYPLTLTPGKYLHSVVEQDGIDVVVTILGPDGKPLAQVDRPSGLYGPEGISLISDQSGTYQLQVRPLERVASPGRYTVKLSEIRDAISRDESRIVAERAVTAGEELRAQMKAEFTARAIGKFEQALALWRALNEPYEEAVALYAIGLSYRQIGENQKAIDYFSKASSLMRKIENAYGEAVVEAGLGFAYFYLGENELSLKSFQQSLSLRRFINDPRGEALTVYGTGWIYVMLGLNDRALDYFSRALVLRRASNDRSGEAFTLTGIAKIYNQQGKHQESLDILNRALELVQSDKLAQADTLSIKGWVYSSIAEYEKALSMFNEALPLRRQVGDRTGEATTLYGIAEVERRRGNLLSARGHMEMALDIIESLAIRGTSQQLRLSYFASVQSYYDSYIDLLQQLDKLYPAKGYTAVALHASERARARNFLELLAESRVDMRQGVDSALLQSDQALRKKINAAAERQRLILAGEYTDQQRTEVARDLDQLTKEYQEVQAEIRASNPHYATIMRPAPLSAQEIQQQVLDDQTLLLEYALGREKSYLWAVTSTAIHSYELPKREIIETAARRVYEIVTAQNRIAGGETTRERMATASQAEAEYALAAMELSRMLLGPVAGRLGTKRILISAMGVLELIPFSALPVPVTDGGSALPKPLVLGHEIVMVPSASALAVQRRAMQGRQQASKMLAVIGDPVFARDDERVRPSSAEFKRSPGGAAGYGAKADTDRYPEGVADVSTAARSEQPLPRLFGTRWEAQEIFALAPPARAWLSLDFDANLASATSGELAQYQIIHFATHAVINDAHPELSALVLSLVDERGRAQGGYLHAFEVLNLKLPAELVVLSGCQTSLGKDFKGEGLVGLTKSFMYAGARRVVASLWSLNDKATAELMTRFYRKMLGPENLRPAAALRAAQIEMRRDKRWQSPYFWAAFVLQGEWR